VLLRFCIRDTGIGMDAGQQAGLFSAFSQADSSITRRFGGTGLGLAICKRLVELMGGSIDLRSTLGEGSEFRVTLPLKVAEAGQGANPLERLDDLHLLVVDDNQTSRDYLCKTIQAWNWRVDSAASGAQGIECLRAQNAKGARYDMVLVDWQMPGMDGLATMHALREMLAESATPVVIMVNAFGRGKLIQEKTASQADAILIKPVTGSSLFDALHESLAVRSGDERKSPFEPRTFAIHHRIDGAHLLLVEDNPLNQIVAKGMLEQAGATVDVADNGLVAIGLLSGGARNYDLILMDVQMPVMDGFATTRTIRDELKLTIPILAMTAGVMLSEREQCTASGMNDFIAKPIDIDQMFGMIVRYLPARSKAAQDIPAATGIPAAIRKQEADPVFDPAQLLMVAEDNPAYRSQLLELIRNVVERSPDQILDARLAWKEGRIDDAARVFHTLRGPIGMLGAKQFTALSLEIENAIRSGQAVRVASLFDIAEQNLNLTVAAARHWLEQQAIPDSELQPDASADQFEFAQVERLRALLSERDLEACDVYTELRTSLHGRLALEDITALDVAMERLQFREVLQQLQRLME
jgi:CheY-like chemotaxis protein